MYTSKNCGCETVGALRLHRLMILRKLRAAIPEVKQSTHSEQAHGEQARHRSVKCAASAGHNRHNLKTWQAGGTVFLLHGNYFNTVSVPCQIDSSNRRCLYFPAFLVPFYSVHLFLPIFFQIKDQVYPSNLSPKKTCDIRWFNPVWITRLRHVSLSSHNIAAQMNHRPSHQWTGGMLELKWVGVAVQCPLGFIKLVSSFINLNTGTWDDFINSWSFKRLLTWWSVNFILCAPGCFGFGGHFREMVKRKKKNPFTKKLIALLPFQSGSLQRFEIKQDIKPGCPHKLTPFL